MSQTAFLDKCEECFNTRDFYQVLKISRDASAKEIKKAYYKLSLIVHPDRVDEPNKAKATEQFKVLSKIHWILQDKEKRKVYDDCGDFDDDNDTSFNWVNYWRSIFKKITVEDINNHKSEYINSERERLDIKKAYVNGKGNMDFILEAVPFSDCENEPRIIEIVRKMVDDGEVENYSSFFNEPKKKKERRLQKWQREARKVEELNVSAHDLEMQIQKQQEERLSFYEQLEKKYGKPKATKRKSIQDSPINKRPRRNKKQ